MAGSNVNAVQGLAPGGPGTTAKATVTAGSTSTATQIRAATSSGGFVVNNQPAVIVATAVETATGPGIHIVFGDSTVGAPTAADYVLAAVEGACSWAIPANVTHFRIFGEGTSAGSVYVYVAG